MSDKANRKGLFSGTGEFPEDTYGYTTQRRNTAGLPLGAELAVDFTPVVGDIKAGIETADYLRQGDYGNALLSGIGVLPFVPPLAGSIKKIYHGTSPNIANIIDKTGFDVSKSADGTIWFTTDPNIGEVTATGKGGKVTRVLPDDYLNLAGWDEVDKYSIDELINLGYDGVKYPNVEDGFAHYQIFHPEKLKKITPDTSYRMQHQPRGPMDDNPIRLDDLTRSTTGEVAGYPEDFYSPKGLRYYANPNYKADVESYNLIRKLRGKPDAEVTIYRGVPKGVKNINEGDFVTLSKQYAKDHAASGYGRSGKEAGDVIEMKVKVKDIFWDGNDVNEFGYFPESSVVKTSRATIIE